MELIPNEPNNTPETTRLNRVVEFLSKIIHKANVYLFGDITPISTDDNDTDFYSIQPTENNTENSPNQTTDTDL